MGTYTGTSLAETITPTFVSPTVARVPAGSFPSSSADTINGGGRGDTVSGGGGDDVIHDRPEYLGAVALTPNDGNAVHGDAGNDDITIEIGDTDGANPASNIAYGDDGNNSVTFLLSARNYPDGPWEGSAPSGTVSLYGGAGDDSVAVRGYYVGSAPGMTVHQYGGSGNDKLFATAEEYDPDGSVTGSNNNDYLYGGTGNDEYTVIEAKDSVIELAGEGIDTVFAYDMGYTLPANVENLEMTGGYYPSGQHGAGNELANLIRTQQDWAYADYTLDGMGGNDVIYGCFGGKDTISGGAGNDTLYGKVAGGDGSWDPEADADTIRGGAGDDLIYGAGGDADTWDGADTLYGDDGSDRIFGHNGNDQMYGGTGNDEMGGQAGADTMYGEAGADKLGGGSGNDTLDGGLDNDTLAGRDGLDRLTGGGGNDIFDYDYATNSQAGAGLRDVITDFGGIGSSLTIDRIDLSTIDANTGLSGNQAFAFNGAAAFTGAGQLRVASSGTDTVIQANTGGSLAPDMEIAVTDGGTLPGAWAAGDFIL